MNNVCDIAFQNAAKVTFWTKVWRLFRMSGGTIEDSEPIAYGWIVDLFCRILGLLVGYEPRTRTST